jgi:hypothetical protein
VVQGPNQKTILNKVAVSCKEAGSTSRRRFQNNLENHTHGKKVEGVLFIESIPNFQTIGAPTPILTPLVELSRHKCAVSRSLHTI